ncbi:MAG: hypothetical protein CVT84_16995, partial [Alphaproteobacteria bacterium HGW-Alphaproteobacteria-6]
PSTRMCLEALEEILLRDRSVEHWRVLDVGTGTGILGIACAKLHAASVLGVDIDPKATEIAGQNVLINQVDDRVEIGTRAIKLALRRLRRWAREGAAEELDLGATVRATAEQGWLDVRTRPERHNAVKVLLFLDVGGSMDDHVRLVEELFSAARSEFRHLEQFNFHNCPYEGLWRDNRRRHEAPIPTAEVIRRFGPDHKAIFVGDATMSPYEISHPGGAIEHWNAEAGAVWLRRLCEQWPGHVWLNPVPEAQWPHSPSVAMIAGIFGGAMHPLTLAGLGAAIDAL